MGSALSNLHSPGDKVTTYNSEQQRRIDYLINLNHFILPPDLPVQAQMHHIISHWIRLCGHNPSTFSVDVMQLIIEKFVHQSCFDTEQRLKLDLGQEDYSKIIGRRRPGHPNYDFLFKVLVIGNSGVGKTSIIRRYIDGDWGQFYITNLESISE